MTDQETAGRITDALRAAFAKSFGSMTGKQARVAVEREAGAADWQDALIWEQWISPIDKPCLWICAGRSLWTAAGQMTLAAVGIDSVTDEDCRSTWHEIVSQTIGAFCTRVSSDVGQEIAAGQGLETPQAPEQAEWVVFTAADDDGAVWHLKIGWLNSLPGLYSPKELQKISQPAPGDKTSSRTFDLLLDVPLPVSVSFGKTSLELREVLKLNKGSIVELNRFVAEPVEVIVNDCVIAHGEVVVVDGNYGVRITQLSSREERLKFGMAETSSRFGTPLR